MSLDTETLPSTAPSRTQLRIARRTVRNVLKNGELSDMSGLLVPTDMPGWLRRATGTEEDPTILAANCLADKKKIRR